MQTVRPAAYRAGHETHVYRDAPVLLQVIFEKTMRLISYRFGCFFQGRSCTTRNTSSFLAREEIDNRLFNQQTSSPLEPAWRKPQSSGLPEERHRFARFRRFGGKTN
jgi:hypothetical protein